MKKRTKAQYTLFSATILYGFGLSCALGGELATVGIIALAVACPLGAISMYLWGEYVYCGEDKT